VLVKIAMSPRIIGLGTRREECIAGKKEYSKINK